MAINVVKIDFSATVDGENLAVEGASISLGVNMIPSVELQCAPSISRSTRVLHPNVEIPKISTFSELYKRLSGKAAGLNVTGNVNITIKDNNDRTDTLSLKGWILSGVGLSSLSATAAPYMSVVLQHPICKLTKLGAIYETPKTRVDNAVNKEIGEKTAYLDIMEAAYLAFREKVDYWPVRHTGDANIAVQYRERLGTGEYDPKRYLTFKNSGGSDIFLGSYVGGAKSRVAQAIARTIVQSHGSTSTWDTITSSAGNVLLSVTQDEENNFTTDKLVLEPTQPWKTYGITLNEDDCFSVELPGMDPYKINGVMVSKLGPYNEPVNTGCTKNGNLNTQSNMSTYMYNPVTNIGYADGCIMKVCAPSVLEAALGRDAEKGDEITTTDCDAASEYKDVFNDAITRYAKAVYEISAASQVSARVEMALWFRDRKGKLILPGNTCKFASAEGDEGFSGSSEGEEIFYGYITRVVHNLNALGGNSTVVVMAHARSTADFMVNGEVAIRAGSKNAAYE